MTNTNIDIDRLIKQAQEITQARAEEAERKGFLSVIYTITGLDKKALFDNGLSKTLLTAIGYNLSQGKLSKTQARDACQAFFENAELVGKYCSTLPAAVYGVYNEGWYKPEQMNNEILFFRYLLPLFNEPERTFSVLLPSAIDYINQKIDENKQKAEEKRKKAEEAEIKLTEYLKNA